MITPINWHLENCNDFVAETPLKLQPNYKLQ